MAVLKVFALFASFLLFLFQSNSGYNVLSHSNMLCQFYTKFLSAYFSCIVHE